MDKIKTSNLYEFLELIRNKPELYIGEKSFSILSQNINGYNLYCLLNNIEENLNPNWKNFHDFVAKHLNYSESTSGYKNMILEKNNFDELKSFNMFYAILEIFKTD